jgi:hypothetical protein
MTWRTARMYSRAGGTFAATDPSSAPKPPPRQVSSVHVPSGPGRPPPPSTIPRPQPTGMGPVPRPTGLDPSSRPRPGLDPERKPWGFYPVPRSPDPTVFHPPGPGIGLQPGPAPALGRPGTLTRDHGAWKNESCYSRGSKGWKPDILSIGDAHNCPNPRGPQSPDRPPNISDNPAGYNTRMFRREEDIVAALSALGYGGTTDAHAILRQFQGDWNLVVQRIAYVPDRYREIVFAHLPEGLVIVDGKLGPQSLNALEIAIINQNASPSLSWGNVMSMVRTSGDGYGRKKIYNAVEG